MVIRVNSVGSSLVYSRSIILQVNSETLYLKEQWGDLAVWPLENGRFDFSDVLDGTVFDVMGECKEMNAPQNAFAYTAAPTSSSGVTSSMKSLFNRPFVKKGNSSSSSFGCKIILAEMKKTPKGVTFSDKNQTFITVNEETANVTYILQKVKEKFGEGVLLVSGNGLPILDEEGTRGSKFWKVASRKIYAVCDNYPPENRPVKKPKRRLPSSSSSSDSDDFQPKQKNVRSILRSFEEDLKKIGFEVTGASCALESVVKMLQDLTTVTSAMPLPPSVVKLINDAFKCKVCLKLPMHPPIIATRCCNTLLGCSQCINHWYSGEDGLNKTCPHYREPQGYAQTYQFKGLDEFLEGFQKALSGNTEDQADN
ncbi:uncharacterized protein [Montipora capricornis]|uniref:uncharacterized protein n=1 Tax=Montipora capricornis TaxID=246305 RepID=UPI0035F20FD6